MGLLNGRVHGVEWEHVTEFIINSGINPATGTHTQTQVQGHHFHTASGVRSPSEMLVFKAAPSPGERSLTKLAATNPARTIVGGHLACIKVLEKAGLIDDPVAPE